MKRLAALVICASLTAFALSGPLPKDPRDFLVRIAGKKNEVIPGLLLVKYRASHAKMLERSIAVRSFQKSLRYLEGSEMTGRIADTGWTVWRIPTDVDPRVMAKMVAEDPSVVHAQPANRVYALYTEPDDPDYHYMESDESLIMSSGENVEPFRRLWHLEETNTIAAWGDYPNVWYNAANKPSNVPLIAVIDTGTDMSHPDFRNRDGFGTDVSQGGQLVHSLSKQFRFGELDTLGSPNDHHGHGTHVAGLALASGNNRGLTPEGSITTGDSARGVLGIGYNAKGMVLRVFDDQGVGSDADAAAAIFYAADNGADIINLSIGTENYSQLFQDAVTYAWQKGCLVIAAGNEDGNGGGDLGPIYPAACSGALGVSANGPDKIPAIATYSGYGPYVDIAAPGGDVITQFDGTEFLMKIQFVYSTAMQEPGTLNAHPTLFPPYSLNYAYLAGTSMATPIVSGAAALYYGRHGLDRDQGYINVQAYRAIEKSAESVMGAPNGGWEPMQGYGSLDTQALLWNDDTRQALVGAVEGIVYLNATPVSNVQVRARRNSNGVNYSTTTLADGTYRFDQLPPGQYTMTTAPFGSVKTRQMIVKAGSDSPGTDFWCGTFTWDETPPVVGRFVMPVKVSRPDITLVHWGYDPETGVDSVKVQMGTTLGGSETYPVTEIVPDGNRIRLTGMTLQAKRLYYVRVTYTNGAGMVTTVDGTFRYQLR